MIEKSTPNILLHGGPDTLTLEQRLVSVTDPTLTTVKIPRGNRYEHFQETSVTTVHEGCEVRVFLWTGSTYVAE